MDQSSIDASRANPAGGVASFRVEMLLHDLSGPLRHIDLLLREVKSWAPAATIEQRQQLARLGTELGTARALLKDARFLLSGNRRPRASNLQRMPINAE